jgi:hypothetical protein
MLPTVAPEKLLPTSNAWHPEVVKPLGRAGCTVEPKKKRLGHLQVAQFQRHIYNTGAFALSFTLWFDALVFWFPSLVEKAARGLLALNWNAYPERDNECSIGS